MGGKTRPGARLWTLPFVILCLTNLCICMAQKMTNVTVGLHISRLGGSAATIGLSMAVFSLTAIVARLASGRLTDKIGSSLPVAVGTLTFALSSLAYILAEGPLFIIFMRLFQGLGYAAAATALTVAAANTTPPERMGEGMGYYGLAISLSAAVGPQLALTVYGGGGYDLLQWLIAGFLLLACMGGLFVRSGRARPAPGRAAAKRRGLGSVIEKSAIKTGLITLCAYLGLSIFFTFISVYAELRGFASAGIFFTLSAVFILLSRVFCGRLYDRYGALFVLIPSMLLGALTLTVLALTHSEAVFLLCGALYGFFSGALIPGLNSLAAQSGPIERRGAVMGTYYVFMDIGIGAGGMLWGLLAEFLGYGAAFITGGLCLLASAVLAYAFLRQKSG